MNLIRRVTEARTGLLDLIGVTILLVIGVKLVSGAIPSVLDSKAAALVGAATVIFVVLLWRMRTATRCGWCRSEDVVQIAMKQVSERAPTN